MNEKKLSLLIVDDEKSIRNGLKNGIDWDSYGIEVIQTAKDGEEAFHIIQEYQPDIVITDIRMPVCDGLSLIEKTIQNKIRVSFIIISGFDDFTYAQKAMKFGVTSYLLKPIKKGYLEEEILLTSQKIREWQAEHVNKTVATRKIKQGNIALKQSFLLSLLQSQYSSVLEVKKEIERHQLALFFDNPTIILVFSYEEALAKKELGSLWDNVILFKDSVINIIGEILGENKNEIITDANNNIIVFLQKPFKSVNKEKFLQRICQRIISLVMEYYNVSMYASIGNEVNGLLEVLESYRSALEYLSYRMYEDGQMVYDNTVLAKEQPPDSFASTRNNMALVDAIYLSDKETIKSFTNDFFDSLFYIKFPPPNFIRGMCMYLIINVQKELAAYINTGESLMEQSDYAYINKLNSLQGIKEWTINLFFKYSDYISEHKNMQRDDVIEKVKRYINEHIYEKITAEDVAEHIHLSEKYFMNYFKEKTNENFKSYILDLKMGKAKELLKQGNKSITEIAHRIGYTDYRGFNRIFKKHTGQTPSEFQEKYRLNKKEK